MSSTALAPMQNGAIQITQADRDIIRKTYAKDLNDVEFQLLIAESEHRGLDVVKGEIRAIRFNGQLSIFPTVHGIRKLAGRTGILDGIDGPFWCGPDGKWVEVWDSQTPPTAAKCVVHRKDRSRPTVGIAIWKERKQEFSGKLGPTWAKMPALMLGKVAETDALKRSGLVGDELVWMEDDDEVGGQPIRVVENQWDTANRRVHGAVADRGIGGHPEARALTAAVNPDVRSLKDAAPSDMHAAAGIAENLDPEYAQELIEGTSRLSDPPTAVVADPISDERFAWRQEIETGFSESTDLRATATAFGARAKDEPWRYLDLIELAPSKAFATRYRDAGLLKNLPGVSAAFDRFEERVQIAEQRLKDTPLAEMQVDSWDELNKSLKLKGIPTADFDDILGRPRDSFESAQAALDYYNEVFASLNPAHDDFSDIGPDGELVEAGLPGFGASAEGFTR